MTLSTILIIVLIILLIGAIANEAGLDSRYIGRIEINEDHSFVSLPQGMPKELLQHLKKVWVSGQKLQISRAEEAGGARPGARRGPPRSDRPDRPGGPPKRPPRRRE